MSQRKFFSFYIFVVVVSGKHIICNLNKCCYLMYTGSDAEWADRWKALSSHLSRPLMRRKQELSPLITLVYNFLNDVVQ